MKKHIAFPIRAKDLWLICGVYALYLIILQLSSSRDIGLRYGISGALHIILLLGFLVFQDSRNRFFSHEYSLVRFGSRKAFRRARNVSLLAETLIYWLPHCVLLLTAGITVRKDAGTVIVLTFFWLLDLILLAVMMSAADLLLVKRHGSALLFGLLLSLDYLQAMEMLFPIDFSLFYGTSLRLFHKGTVTAQDLILAAVCLAIKAGLAFRLQRLPEGGQRKRLAPWLRSSLRRVWIGFPLGAILALWWNRYSPGSLEGLWLLSFGMPIAEDLSGFLMILVNTLPFLMACFLFGIDQSKDCMAAAVLSVVREGTRKIWWRRRQLLLLVSGAGYALMILLGETAAGYLIGLRSMNIGRAAAVLLELLCTKAAVGFALLSASAVLCLLLDSRLVFLLISALSMGAQIVAFAPRTRLTTAVLRVFLPCRASLLLHEAPAALQDYSAWFYRGIDGMHPETTAVLSGISILILFGAGLKLAERADFL